MTILETKVAYQDQIIEDLNQVIIEQQKQIDKLIRMYKELTQDEDDTNIKDISLEVPPPHY